MPNKKAKSQSRKRTSRRRKKKGLAAVIKNNAVAIAILAVVGIAIVVGLIMTRENNNIDESLPSLVMISSPTCPPCQMLKPVLKEVRDDNKGIVNVVIYERHSEERNRLLSENNITGVPTLIFIDANGVQKKLIEGPLSKEQLEQEFVSLGWK